jgi:hypothetical protein
MSELSATEREIALMVITDLWNPSRRVEKIASHFNLKTEAVEHLLSRPDFQAEVARQRDGASELTIDDRRTRVSDLQGLFFKIPQRRTALKLKILNHIRLEVGDG